MKNRFESLENIINSIIQTPMANKLAYLLIALITTFSCSKNEEVPKVSILGYELLNQINGHWVGNNTTTFGYYPWFAFDYRPISASHSHSIYEGGTQQNIITSIFIADYEGEQKIMARNGGWLGNQYRATYFVLDKAEANGQEIYYRLVDAIGGEDRAYIEFRFVEDSIYMDAYKDDSGALDQPVHHMGFAGNNRNPNYSESAIQLFDYPQKTSEVNLNGAFTPLIDPDSALFLEESLDPFPKTAHGHLSDLSIDIVRNLESENTPLLLYFSKEELVSESGSVGVFSLDNSVIRVIDIAAEEDNYVSTYLHPDDYYLTVFSDRDNNGYPSSGDISSRSQLYSVAPEILGSAVVNLSLEIQ